MPVVGRLPTLGAWILDLPWILDLGSWCLETHMPLFQYRALQADGAMAEGQLEAAGRPEAFAQMAGLGLRPVSLVENAANQSVKGLGLPTAGLSLSLFKKSDKVSPRALETFTRLL